MSLYMRWPLKKFYTFHHLADFNRNTVSEWTMGFRYGNFTLKLARGKKSLASLGNPIFYTQIHTLHTSKQVFIHFRYVTKW